MTALTTLARLEVTGFRGWLEGSLALDRELTLIVGKNGSGKSSTLNAIEWSLFGKETEKKSSGLPERAGWNAAHGGGDVAAALVFEGPEGAVRIARRRPVGGGARAADKVHVEPEGQSPLEDAAAEEWLAAAGFPDWTTWRRAFCQHQEVIRARLVEGTDLSAILAALLGLDEYDALRRAVKGLGAARLAKELEEIQDQLERELLARLNRPAEDLDEEERQLTGLGIERADLRPELAGEIADEVLARARRLVADLGLAVELPTYTSELDGPALLRWAESWPRDVREGSTATKRKSGLLREHAELSAHLERYELAAKRWQSERERAGLMRRDRGDHAGRMADVERTRAALRGAEDELHDADEHLALIAGAHRHMRAGGETERCPVCESRIRDLVQRLGDEAARAEDGRLLALSARRDSLREQEREQAEHLRELEEAERAETSAREGLEAQARELEGMLPPTRLADEDDAGAAAREESRALARELERLDAVLGRLERELTEHRRGADRLRGLARWRAASQRAARRTEITRAPAWGELEDAIGLAAGLVVDLDAIAAMVRDAEATASDERRREVNDALGEVFAEILDQDSSAADSRALRVLVRQTAKGLSYELCDKNGASVLATWNHASLNAVSLALLFAQASARAARGELAFCLLDDPAQGLDEDRQRALARVLVRLASRVPVIVATTPGVLADELWSHGTTPRRRFVLAPYNASRGTSIESQEER